jgi:tRNA A-37 threonylcarbamoyl transferase component Bud32
MSQEWGMMKTNDLNQSCPKCGTPVPEDAPQGLCPRCVFAGAATGSESGALPTATGEIPSLERLAAAFPQLEVLELIGRGGMGFVFKARQPHLDRFVALKLLPDKLARDPQFAERFGREGRVLAKLHHPDIVSVFDFGQTTDFYFLIMEYVDGVNLRQAMQAGRFSPSEALAVVPQICAALQYAHEQGVLHRDIKPENILLDTKGRVKIADFGIAKLVGEDAPAFGLTGTGHTLGTPHYMAPEQLEKPSEVDHRADIYSLGVVFYEMLTGELPIGRFAPPSSKTPVDAGVDEVVFRTLEKDRDKRYQSASEVKTEVEHLQMSPETHPAGAPAFSPAQDFILCPPVLPRMAKAVIVYALVVAPLLWVVSLLTVTMDPRVSDNPLAAFAQVSLNLLIGLGDFVAVTLLALGGWKLRGLRPSAPRWLKVTLWLHLAWLGLCMAGVVAVEHLVETLTPASPLERISMGDAVFGAIGLAAMVFEISVIIWLRRHGELLKSFCRSRPRKSGPLGTMVLSNALPSGFSRHAVWGAALSGLALVLAGGPVGLVFLGGGGLGAAELLLFGVPGALCALAGTILGWMGLVEIQNKRARVRGLPLALFAALVWPLLTLVAVVLGISALTLVPSHQAGWIVLLGRVLSLLLPAGVLTFVVWAIYATARWANGQPISQRRGVLKWVFAGLLLGGVGIVVVINAGNVHLGRGRAAPSGRWTEATGSDRLAAGSVELLALSRHPSDGTWWRPDGAPSTEGPFENPGVTNLAGPGQRAVEFVFRTRGLPEGASTPIYEFEGHRGASGRSGPRVNGKAVSGGHLYAASFPLQQETTTVHAGIAIDPWETLGSDATREGGGSRNSLVRRGQPWHFTFVNAIEDRSTNTTLTVLHDIQNHQVRAVAVTTDGQEVTSLLNSIEQDHLIATFVGLPRGKISLFHFQARPYRWTEIKEVRLEPSNRTVAATNEIRVKLRIAKGQVATLEVLRRDTDPPTPVPFFSGFVVAPDDERGRCEFFLVPAPGLPHQTNPPTWTIKLVAEDGATTSGGFAELGPLIAIGSPQPNSVVEFGPGAESELMLTRPYATAETNDVTPCAQLSLSVRTHNRRAVSTRPIESTVVSLGSTNWISSVKAVPPPAKSGPQPEVLAYQWRQAPAGTNTTNWVRFTMTSVELRHLPDGRWLGMDYVSDEHGDGERAFRLDGNGFKAVTRTTEFQVGGEDSPPVRHQRVEWRLPDVVKEAEALAFRDTLAKEVVMKSVTVYEGEQRPLFRFPIGTIGDLSVGLGAHLRQAAKLPPGQKGASAPATNQPTL